MLYFHSYSIIICYLQIVLSRTSGLNQMYRDAVNNLAQKSGHCKCMSSKQKQMIFCKVDNWPTGFHCSVDYLMLYNKGSDYMSNMTGVLLESGTTYLMRAPGFDSGFGWFTVVHLCSLLCCVIVFSFVSICLVSFYPILPVSLDLTFLIVPFL